MKKLLTLLFAVALTLSLTSASFAQAASGDTSTDKKTDSTKKTKKTKPPKQPKEKKTKTDKKAAAPADAPK
jgi:hypothetical protein